VAGLADSLALTDAEGSVGEEFWEFAPHPASTRLAKTATEIDLKIIL
jgi:hypothetical protein